MIAMRPIREYDVIDLLNNGRFEGEVEGYVVMDGSKYLGHMLYRVDGAVTQVLECGVEEKCLWTARCAPVWPQAKTPGPRPSG